jgi:cytochrome P450
MVLKEAMRLYPPAWILNGRTAMEKLTIGGYEIAAGSQVYVSPYMLHRLPRYFPEPERFDPERFEPEKEKEIPRYAYIPFGGGPRVCIGNSFAMMEAQLILATIAQRFALELPPGQVVEPLPQITLGAKDGLKMQLRAR